MADFDALYEAVDAEVSDLRIRFIDKFIPAQPEHSPSDFEHDVKAYSILSHAAFEEFIETVSDSVMQKVEGDFLVRRTSLSLECLLTAYGIKLDLSDEDDATETSCFMHIKDAISRAKTQHSERIRKNHGVSAKYIRTLLVPVGINVPTGPEMDSLKKLAEARGSFAHTMAKLAKYGEYKKATKIFTPEEALVVRISQREPAQRQRRGGNLPILTDSPV